MKFGSVCSGIEAASVAWAPLGWKAVWLSEIEPFPSAVLAHHYPDVPNLGDMLALAGRIRSGEIEAPDVLCGGTPCQAFSVAGLRRSLGDSRGNLSLTFCEIADAIDERRSERGEPEAIIFWENVPGVLSTADNAFGCFLAGLAGEDDPLVAPGGKWTNAGYVSGPKRAIAWRILDAQYFGVAQRRRRVFVVASARTGFDPAAVLFEFEGVRRDTAPSREAGEVAPTIPARSLGGGGLGTDFDCDGGVITMAHGQGGAEIGFDRGPTLTCNHEAPIAAYPVAHVDTMPCMMAGGQSDTSHNQIGGQMREQYVVPVHCRELAQTITSNYGKQVDNSNTALGPNVTAVHGTQDPCVSGHTAFALGRNNGGENAIAFAQNSRDEVRLMGGDGQIVGALAAEPGMKQTCYVAQGQAIQRAMQVRRLTPVECERLQGFPDGYTMISWRKKPAEDCPDGPRYKALGNSWAVPNVRWIGRRIQEAISC